MPGQAFAVGDHHDDGVRADGESPVHRVRVSAFSIDATAVTVADFRAFVTETGYRTEAETFGWSAVFHLALTDPPAVAGGLHGTPWWLGVTGADRAHRAGPVRGARRPSRRARELERRPGVLLLAGRRLPTEAEWECAARGGLPGLRYPWGDELPAEGFAANIWQGDFPVRNTAADGFVTTVPVRSFTPDAYGLWQPVGNVWEWCADWFSPAYYALSPVDDPRGPDEGAARVLRGGSYLCHDSYCNRYRNAARSSNTPDSSTGNTEFRTVAGAL